MKQRPLQAVCYVAYQYFLSSVLCVCVFHFTVAAVLRRNLKIAQLWVPRQRVANETGRQQRFVDSGAQD